MSAEAAFITRSWSVGIYTCTLTVPRPKAGAVKSGTIEWSPRQPSRMTQADIAEYRTGRNKALTEIARAMGINAAVLEI